MIIDPSLVTAWHALLVLAVMGATATAIALLLIYRPQSFEIVPGVYAAGGILAMIAGGAAAWFLRSSLLGLGVAFVTLLILIVGRIDERKRLSWKWQLLAQCGIALVAVLTGFTIPYVTHPLHDGVIMLGQAGAIIAFVWIIACMNAMNFFDGTDGVAPSVGAIACLALAAISLLPATQDARTFTLALIGFSVCAAFFFWNAPPAKVYLGTTGSWFVGAYIALVAMLGGGKIATALIVLALPILDACFVILHRIYSKQVPWRGDTVRHIHNRLFSYGLSPWAMVILIAIITAVLACVSVIASTISKLIVFCVLAVVFFSLSSRMMKGR